MGNRLISLVCCQSHPTRRLRTIIDIIKNNGRLFFLNYCKIWLNKKDSKNQIIKFIYELGDTNASIYMVKNILSKYCFRNYAIIKYLFG